MIILRSWLVFAELSAGISTILTSLCKEYAKYKILDITKWNVQYFSYLLKSTERMYYFVGCLEGVWRVPEGYLRSVWGVMNGQVWKGQIRKQQVRFGKVRLGFLNRKFSDAHIPNIPKNLLANSPPFMFCILIFSNVFFPKKFSTNIFLDQRSFIIIYRW